MRADARQNREQILRAAREVFVSEGPDTPLDAIARRAGVGVATLYRRFPSRDDLIRGVAEATFAELYRVIREITAQEPDPFEALRRFAHAALDLRIGAVMPSVSGRVDYDELAEGLPGDAAEALQEVIDQARRAALLRSDVVLGDVVLMLARLSRPLPGGFFADDGALAHRQLEIYLDGLRPSAAWPREEGLPAPAIGFAWFKRVRRAAMTGRGR